MVLAQLLRDALRHKYGFYYWYSLLDFYQRSAYRGGCINVHLALSLYHAFNFTAAVRCCRCSTHSEAEVKKKQNKKSHLWTTAKTLAACSESSCARRHISRPQVPYRYIKISVKAGPEICKAVFQTFRAHAADPLLAPCTLLPCWLLLIEILFGFFLFFFPATVHIMSGGTNQLPSLLFMGMYCCQLQTLRGGKFSMSHLISVGVGGITQPLQWLNARFKYNHKFINLRTITRRRFHRNTANARGRLRRASHPSLRAYSAFTYPQDSFWCTPKTQKDSPRPPHLKKQKGK